MASPSAESAPLVGRGPELAEVALAVGDAAAGPSVLALTGEPGIGKSSLLAEARRLAEEAGMLVLSGRAAEHESDVPFGLVVDALDDQVADMHARRLESLGEAHLAGLGAVLPSAASGAPGAAAAGPAERFLYHRALRSLLELLARERPFALLLDDLHWADEASLELVLHLLRRPPRSPHLLALALRPSGPAPRVIDALRAAQGARVIQLDPLAPAAALALLEEVTDADLRTRLQSDAGGNPLYLTELVRAATDPAGGVPPTLAAAVELEASSLPPASRALLDGAAVAGDPFDPELAAAAADLDPQDALVPLDRLVSLGLVRPAGGSRRFRFRHPVVRRALYDATQAGWRLGAHERAAEALAERGAAPAARAYHVEQAARPGDDDAVTVLSQAAAESLDTSPATAARWYEAALELLPAGEDPRRAGLLAALAQALGAAGRLEECRLRVLEALAALPEDATAARIGLTAACAEVEHVLGRHEEAQSRLRHAHDSLPADTLPAQRADLEFKLAYGAIWAADAPTSGEWSARAVASVGDADPALAAGAHAGVAIAASWGMRPAEAAAALDRATELFNELTDEELAGRLDAAVAVSFANVYGERFPAALAAAERGLEVGRAFKQDRQLAPLTWLWAMALKHLARYEEGLRALEEVEEAAQLTGLRYQLQAVLSSRAEALDMTGRALEAQRVAGECRALSAELGPSLVGHTVLCNTAALLVDTDPERSLREMKEAGGTELELLDPVWATFHMREATLAALAAGRPEEAAEWATRAEERAARLQLPLAAARAITARAAVLAAAGEARRGAELALAAAESAAAVQGHDDAMRARLLAGRALAGVGESAEAIRVLEGLADEAGRVGASKLRAAASRELRGLGVRLQSTAPARGAHADLTGREREIAELVAEGNTNREIAAALFLSEKTVERHLSRLFAKLGVRSRVELAGLLVREEGSGA